MGKTGKCINIFEGNKKNLNLYQLSILIILLITSIQIGINSIKYAQLNDYISNNPYKQNPQEEVVNDLQYENSHTQQSNINLSKLKEVSSIIGEEKIHSIDLDSNRIQMQGYCKNIKILEKVSNLKNIKKFDIKTLEKVDKSDEYFFDIEYK